MTKSEIKKSLLDNGGTYAYSGKTKTIYTNINPNGLTLLAIERSGFNLKVKNV